MGGYLLSNIQDKIVRMAKLRDPLLFIILLASLLLGASVLTRGHEWGDDFASYIMQAQSILNGNMDEFVEHNAFTVFESSIQIGPVAYPWGYPLVLTPVLLLKGVHELALKLPGLMFFAGFLICFYLLIETRLTRTESLLLVSLFAFNPTLIKFLDLINSDIPFLFITFLVLLLTAELNKTQKTGMSILLGVAIFLAFFFRTTGIILLAGFLAYQALVFIRDQSKRRGTVVNTIAVVGAFSFPWVISSLIFPDGQGSYFQQLAGFTAVSLLQNIHDYFYLFVQFFGVNIIWTYVYYFLIILFVIGAWSQRNKDQMLIIFFVLYFAVMLIWPEWQGIRFIFPLIPIFIYFAFQGVKAVIKLLPETYHPFARWINYALWIALVGIFLLTSGTRAYTNLKDDRKINGPFDSVSDEMFDYIKIETPSDSVIVFFKPRAMRLFTNRDSIMSVECDRLLLGDYVALHKNWEYSQILPDEIGNCNLHLKEVFENRRFIVYEIPK
jgi:4-amino-4-deoxy-L-arabinose transferase-like glycosyltransferase